MHEFQTNKTNLFKSRIVEVPPLSVNDGEVLVKIDRFALTANNITYAVMGDRLRYWEFFPPSGDNTDDNAKEWGPLIKRPNLLCHYTT